MSPMLVDEPTVTRALPLATPPAVAPVGAGTISAVVSQAPPPRPPRVNGARVAAIAAAAALVGVATYSFERARAPRVEPAAQGLVAAPSAVPAPTVAAPLASPSAIVDAAVAVVDAPAAVVAAPPAAPMRPPATRGDVRRPRTTRAVSAPTRPRPPVDERPPLE